MRRLFVVIICLVCLFVVTSNCSATYASTNQTKVEKQRAEIRQKINFLSKLERQESSKLNKNQQKLEKNQKALENSKKQYDKKQDRIDVLQKDLNFYLNQYNSRQSASAERIRTIYKTKHTLKIV